MVDVDGTLECQASVVAWFFFSIPQWCSSGYFISCPWAGSAVGVFHRPVYIGSNNNIRRGILQLHLESSMRTENPLPSDRPVDIIREA